MVVASARGEATIGSLAEHERPSIEMLMNAHLAFIWRVFRRMGLAPADADDAAQQVFMIASTKLDHIAPERERAYLYGIAMRVLGHARRTERRRREVSSEHEHAPEPGPGPDTHLELQKARQLLDELLGKLPDKLRRVMVLAEIEELEVSEIAALEEIPIGTAASRLRLGRERLRALLVKHAARNPFGGET